MTCYFKRMRQIFEKAGIIITNQNKREVDRTIHELVGIEYKNCAALWKEVKKIITYREEEFISQLHDIWTKRSP